MRPIILIIGVLLIALMSAIRVADPLAVQTVRNLYFDTLQQIAPRQPADVPVRIVDVDEASLAEFGQWPWPRDLLAELVHELQGLGAAVIVFDVLFAEPDRYSPSRLLRNPKLAGVLEQGGVDDTIVELDNDAVFAQAIGNTNVVLGVAETRDVGSNFAYNKAGFVEIGLQPSLGVRQSDATTPLVSQLGELASGIGSITVSAFGQTNIVRTVPLLWRNENGLIPGLSLEALRVALGETTFVVGGSQELEGVVDYISFGGLTVPTTEDGQFWVRYREYDAADYVSVKDVFDTDKKQSLKSQLEGHIVLVGTSAPGLLDIRATPLGVNVPGVSIHAQIIEQILLGEFLYRSDFVAGLELLAFIVFGGVVTLVMARYRAAVSIASGGVAALLLVAGSFYAFVSAGLLFDVTFPIIGGAVNFGALAAYQFIIVDREKRFMRAMFSHHVSPTVLNEMEQNEFSLELGGETRDITVLFVDVRDFTALSENFNSTDLVSLLNKLFTTLGAAILKQQGTIDKFMGDAIMAFWNAPLTIADHKERACMAMLEMRAALERFNNSPDMVGKKPIRIGMGCATGAACVGNIGSVERFNYTAIGDTVNVAARVETSSKTVGYDIVLLRQTPQPALELALLPAGIIDVKGKSERLPLDIIVGGEQVAQSHEFEELKQMHFELVGALQAGAARTKIDNLIARCRQCAKSVEPNLDLFYAHIADRKADFLPTIEQV